jgi:putative tryptophan/tyrosine transport system substrate-binding protein
MRKKIFSMIPTLLVLTALSPAAAQRSHKMVRIGVVRVEFDGVKKQRAEGMIILASPILTAQRSRLAEMTVRDRLPAIYYHEGFTSAAGLMAYGPKESDFNWRRAAIFVDKILKGAKPADLPVEQLKKFVLVIILKTAKQIG